MHSAARKLATEIDKLSLPKRLSYLAGYARRADRDELAAVVRQWQTDGPFYQRLAIHLATVARQPGLLTGLIDDPVVGPTAIARLAELGAAGEVAARLGELPRLHRDAFYRALRRYGLADLADAVIGPIQARFGDQEAARIIGACSPAVAAEYLPGLIQLVGQACQPSIDHLARRAPDLVLGTLAAWLEPLPRDWASGQVVSYSPLLAILAQLRPQTVFDLVERYLNGQNFSTGYVSPQLACRLAAADGPRLAAWLAQASDRVNWNLLTRAVARQLVRQNAAYPLLAHFWRNGQADKHWTARLLRAIPPSERANAIGPELLAIAPVNTPATAALLPAAERHQCAHRWLQQHAGDPTEQRLPWLGLLPLAEVDEAWALTRNTDPDYRIIGYRTVLQAAFQERSETALADTIKKLTRLTNEQDPVRQAVAQALADGWRDRPIPLVVRDWLAGFITAVRQARDTSGGTVEALQRLATSALNQSALLEDGTGVEWALDQIEQLWATAYGLLKPHGLSRAALAAALPRLAGWLERWPLHRRLQQIAQLHQLHRPELWDFTAPFLEKDALQDGSWQSNAIISYLDDPRHRAERVAQIIRLWPSAGYIPTCAAILTTIRTDLLDAYLTAHPINGQFTNSTGFFIPWLPHRYSAAAINPVKYWLPRQQSQYVEAIYRRMFALKNLPLNWATAARLTALADDAPANRLQPYLKAKAVIVREAALGVLGHAWPPAQAAKRLLEEADTDRARVAMYALMPALKRLPPDQAVALLQPYLTGRKPAKVTSQKALLHITDELPLPGAAELLVEALHRPDQHRDVKYVTVALLSRHLGDPMAQNAIAGIATADNAALAGILRTPATILSAAGRTALAQLVAGLMTVDDAITRSLARANYQTLACWAPQGNATLIRQLLNPAEAEWHYIGTTLGAVASQGVLDGVVAAGAELARHAADEAAQADYPNTEADLPSLRRLEIFLTAWAQQSRPSATSLAALQEVATNLGSQELTRPLAVCALLQCACLADPPRLDEDLVTTATGLCPPWMANILGNNLMEWTKAAGPDELIGLAGRYCDTPTAGLVVPLTDRAGGMAGWPSPWLDILRRLRQHQNPAVRAVAYDIDATTGRPPTALPTGGHGGLQPGINLNSNAETFAVLDENPSDG